MVLYYNPCTNMFPSGATHHRLHQSVTTTSAATYNFTPTSSSLTGEQQNCYSIYNSNSANASNSSANSGVGLLSSGAQLGLSSSPISQYPSEITGLPAMASEVLQSQPMPGPSSWYPLASSLSSSSVPNSIRGPASMVAGSPFDEWPLPNSGSPSNSCISGSPVSALPPCAYAAMSMPASYGQVGAYHPHSGFHRSDHYPDHHHHHHYHPHPHANSNIIPVGNSEAAPVHPSPDSGLTASSDGGTDSPNGQQSSSNTTLNATPTIVKTENGANRPQPARSPYEWMKKPSYQNQLNAGNPTSKTRTKDKYRVVYSDQQRLELEKEFHYSRYITIRRKSELASMLGLSERQVKIWFQNRRAKERKQAKKRDEIIRKEKEHQLVHNHTQQIHSNFALC